MLRAQVRLGRNFTRNGRTDEYAVTLDGDIPFAPDDASGVIEKVSELFHLAKEALVHEIERDQSDHTPGHRDQGSHQQHPQPQPAPTNNQAATKPNGNQPDPATPKQIKYMLSLGKRQGLSREQLDDVIFDVLQRPARTGDLSKREAGRIIDHLSKQEAEGTK